MSCFSCVDAVADTVSTMLTLNDSENVTNVAVGSPEGERFYKRSIAFVLGAAATACKLGPFQLEDSIGASFHFKLRNASVDSTVALTLTNEMKRIISDNLPILLQSVPRLEAIGYFERIEAVNTVALLRATASPFISCHVCDLGDAGKFMSVAFSPLVVATGIVNPVHFRIEVATSPFPHFRLHHPILHSGKFGLLSEASIRNEDILMSAIATRKTWNAKLGMDTVSKINTAATAGRTKSVIQLSEALHDHQICTIASRIAGVSSDNVAHGIQKTPRLVLIAGPSSSGKTTFAKRLCVSLEAQGLQPIVLSVDSYYKGWPDIDARGVEFVDWESLNSLNLIQLNEHLLDLLAGKEVLVPEYDMRTSLPMSQDHWTKMKLPEGGVVIMEGIHCLNPELTPRVARNDKFHIMISPLSSVILDDSSVVSSSQIRMMRRMVRDNLFRGRSAVSTLRQWPSVALGERTNIYPNQNNADAVMNSGLPYEANVLKVFAEPLLRTILPDEPEFAEARRLILMMDQLVTMPAKTVPPQSLLREFIGGSWYYDYAGLYKTA